MKYQKLNPFKRCVLENFPFIEADFDALTNYELMCKIVEYLNKVIKQTNDVSEDVNNLINWFNNLDVQDEIDAKLDKMVQDGTFDEIINHTLFNKLNEDIETIFNKLNEDIETIESDGIICIGDSYTAGANPGGVVIESWATKLKNKLGYNNSNFFISAYGGTGFFATADEKNFLSLLQDLDSTITDKTKIKHIYVLGGYNDQVHTVANIRNGIRNFISYAKANYPNATIKIGCVGYSTSETDSETREALYTKAIPSYKYAQEVGANYLYNSEYILHNPLFISSDNVHPNETGQEELSRFIYSMHKGVEYNPDYLQLSSGKLALTTYDVLTSLGATDSNIEFGKEVHNDFTKYAVQGFISANMSTSGGNGKIAISNLETKSGSDTTPRFQITSNTLNKEIMVRVHTSSTITLIPAILNYDGINVNILFYNTISEITALFIPYQEFEIPTILS